MLGYVIHMHVGLRRRNRTVFLNLTVVLRPTTTNYLARVEKFGLRSKRNVSHKGSRERESLMLRHRVADLDDPLEPYRTGPERELRAR